VPLVEAVVGFVAATGVVVVAGFVVAAGVVVVAVVVAVELVSPPLLPCDKLRLRDAAIASRYLFIGEIKNRQKTKTHKSSAHTKPGVVALASYKKSRFCFGRRRTRPERVDGNTTPLVFNAARVDLAVVVVVVVVVVGVAGGVGAFVDVVVVVVVVVVVESSGSSIGGGDCAMLSDASLSSNAIWLLRRIPTPIGIEMIVEV
jgi:hypothetical protein